jgi:hypothetical protein
MRRMFGDEIQPKLDNGQYRLNVLKIRPPNREWRDQLPPGTKSVYYEVIDLAANKSIVEGHRYVDENLVPLPNHPFDPKIIVKGETTYQVQPRAYKAR